MTHFSQQIDSNENPIIQSLEALLNTEEPSVKIPLDCFEAMSLRSRFREGYSLDQTKDSGFAYHPSNSFASSWQHSGNTSIQNQSTESGFASESFDIPFHFKPRVKNVSFDGCFMEDDANASVGEINLEVSHPVWGKQCDGILSSAISQGGDFKTAPSTNSIENVYSIVKYSHMVNKCWNTLSCVTKLRCQLVDNPDDSDDSIEFGDVESLLDTFRREIDKVIVDFKGPRLNPILADVRIALDMLTMDGGNVSMDRKWLKQLRCLISNVFVALYSECVLQNPSSVPSEDRFRSEKRFQIWNSLA